MIWFFSTYAKQRDLFSVAWLKIEMIEVKFIARAMWVSQVLRLCLILDDSYLVSSKLKKYTLPML